jgi:hypothetical protein
LHLIDDRSIDRSTYNTPDLIDDDDDDDGDDGENGDDDQGILPVQQRQRMLSQEAGGEKPARPVNAHHHIHIGSQSLDDRRWWRRRNYGA